MYNDIIKNSESKMKKTISVLREELITLRAGRANPQILDKVTVEYYGSPTPLKQLAAVGAPEPRLITIQPYDATILGDIERAILIADLGFNPSNDGKVIRIAMPMLTEERRKDLVKQAKKAGEESKVALRNERRNGMDVLKKLQKDNELTEDELKKAEDLMQKTIDKYVKEIDEVIAHKEKEIMEV